jgi:hypothetical protein
MATSNRRRTAKIDAEKKIADFYEVNKPKRVHKKKGGGDGKSSPKKRSPAKGKAKKARMDDRHLIVLTNICLQGGNKKAKDAEAAEAAEEEKKE